jgi:hypothetical protein
MEHGEFAEILEGVLARVSAVLGVKTAEYAREDQLHNIRLSAHLQGESLAEAVAGMMVKHTVSIYTMIKDGRPHPEELWDEKITDHMIWLVLLKAALIEGAQNPLDAKVPDVLRAQANAFPADAYVEIDGHKIPVVQVLEYAASISERSKTNPGQETLPC